MSSACKSVSMEAMFGAYIYISQQSCYGSEWSLTPHLSFIVKFKIVLNQDYCIVFSATAFMIWYANVLKEYSNFICELALLIEYAITFIKFKFSRIYICVLLSKIKSTHPTSYNPSLIFYISLYLLVIFFYASDRIQIGTRPLVRRGKLLVRTSKKTSLLLRWTSRIFCQKCSSMQSGLA